MEKKVKGKLMIIGGAEEKKGECIILKKLFELAGGQDANIVIMTVASEYPEKIGDEYTQIFKRFGAGSINAIHIRSRQDANHSGLAEQIEKASCIFFTEDQLRITSLLGGTGRRDVGKGLQQGVL